MSPLSNVAHGLKPKIADDPMNANADRAQTLLTAAASLSLIFDRRSNASSHEVAHERVSSIVEVNAVGEKIESPIGP